MLSKMLGIALVVVGVIGLTMLLYAQYILDNPIDIVLWIVPIVCIFMGFIFFVVAGTKKEPYTRISVS